MGLEEQLLRALLEHTGDRVYAQDLDGRICFASESLARSLGFDDPSQLIGRPAADLASAGDGLMQVPLHDDRGEVVGAAGVGPAGSTPAAPSVDPDLDSVMQLLCVHAMELTGATGTTVALLEDGELRIAASRGTPEHRIGELLDRETTIAGRALNYDRSLLTTDAPTDERVTAARVKATGVRSIIAVPLRHAGSSVGVLIVLSTHPDAFDEEHVRTLELLAPVVSAGMSHAAELQAKRDQVDALTRFRTIFEGASVGFVRARADGRAIEVNEAVLKMLGFEPEEHTSQSFELFTHPDDVEMTREQMRQLMAGERDAYEHDKRYITKTGEVVWVHVRAWLEPEVEGEPRTAIATIENINERKLAELALRDNSERLARVVETQRDIAAAGVDLDSVMQLIVERSQGLTVAEGAIVSLLDGDDLVVGAASGVAAPLLGTRRPVAQSVVRYAFEAADTLLIEHAEGDPRLYSQFARSVRDRSHICVPLLQGDRPVGALNVMTTSERGARLGENDRRTLELLAVVLASALSRAAEFDAKRRQVEALARFEATYTSALAGIVTLDTEGKVVDANPALQALMGYTEEEFAGTQIVDYVHPDDRDATWAMYLGRERGEGSATLEHRVLCKDGTVLWVNSSVSFVRGPEDEPTMAIVMIQDVTTRKRAEEALRAQSALNEHQARHDPLTGLANRTLFAERIESALGAAEPESSTVAVMVMDVDRFKEVNDSLGHHAGDELLREIARRLTSALRSSDPIARIGGDEFGVLLPAPQGHADVAAAVERLVGALEEPILVEGLPLVVEASIGIALYADDGTDMDTLLRAADVAMYTAKEEKTSYAFFDGTTRQLDLARLTLVGELRRALEKRELVLHYQPQARLDDGTICSVEALLRWNHPERGLIPPAEFIPLAQQTGLIRPLTLYVLGEAIRQCREWEQNGLRLSVAVNVSTRNLLDVEFPDQVQELLDAWHLDAGRLELEITEDAVLTDPVRTTAILDQLAAMDVRLSIDDFGTGYSSLAYLKRLPIKQIKIDRSFVMGMSSNEDDATIVRSTIDLGRNLGLDVVAEGVESELVWKELRALGCTIAQGYYLSRPLPVAELREWLSCPPPRTPARPPADAPARR